MKPQQTVPIYNECAIVPKFCPSGYKISIRRSIATKDPLKSFSVFVTITSSITQANSLEFGYTYTWSLEKQICRSKPSFPDDKGPPFRKPTRLSTTWMDVVAKLCPVFGEGMSYLVSQFCGMEKRPRQCRQRASLQKTTHKRLHGLNMGTGCLIQRRGLQCCIVHAFFWIQHLYSATSKLVLRRGGPR